MVLGVLVVEVVVLVVLEYNHQVRLLVELVVLD
jgi:hypothetical protein